MKFYIWTFLFLFVFIGSSRLTAEHIVGGEGYYTCMMVNTGDNTVTYQITFTLYRDAAGGGSAFDPDASFGVYEGSGSNWQYVRTVVNQNVTGVQRIVVSGSNPCLVVPSNIRVDKGDYIFEITLPISNQSYIIAYQRCCRNATINNILDPNDTGAAFIVEINPEAQTSCNSSPRFVSFPPSVICLGEEIIFDHSAIDNEGDILVYEFCTPQDAGGPDGRGGGNANSCEGIRPDVSMCPPPFNDVIFMTPTFNFNQPLGPGGNIRINSQTGQITGVPVIEGQFVVGVCVREFRNGELLSEVRRDFQFNVKECDAPVVARIEADLINSRGTYIINSCNENDLLLVNESFKEENIKSYSWVFDDASLGNIDSRDAAVLFPGPGSFTGTMTINVGSECVDNIDFQVNIYPEIIADYGTTYDTCVAGPVFFEDNTFSAAGAIAFWEWQLEGADTLSTSSFNYRYVDPGQKNVKLIVEDINGCIDSLESSFLWQPAPPLVIVEPSTFVGCLPASVFFDNLSSPIDETYDVLWDFGDGQMGEGISPTHIFIDTGRFDIGVDITSPIGCKTSRIFRDLIFIEPSPTSQFNYTPEQPSFFSRDLTFTNNSEGGIGWLWEFGDGSISYDFDANHMYSDTGRYVVSLITTNEVSCSDTFIQVIDILPISTFHMPTAFTPNNDSQNDIFIGRGFYDGLRNYSFAVFNRWGQRVFNSSEPRKGWNGRFNNTGEDAPIGVYLYTLSYTDTRGNVESLRGHVTLVR